MTSSLVDLEPPKRRPSVGSLRHVSSDLHLGPVAALPAALGGSGIRPGNPNRPAASRNAEWVNPLDVHFGKDQTSQRPGPAAAVAATVPAVAVTPPSNVGQTDGAHGRVEPSKPTTATAAAAAAAAAATASGYPAPSHAQNSAEETVILNGHPSPPASHRYSDAAASSSLNDDTSGIYPSAGEFKANASGALTQSDVPEMEPLPSPATSVRGTSEERTEGPVVRNVPVRRDTLAFHQPRRPSCALEFEEGHRRATTMHLSTERFSGNFADFDFGETVTKTASNTTVGEETTCLEHVMTSRLSRGSSNDGQVKPNKRLSSWSVSGPHAGEREGSASPAPTQASEDQTSNSALIDQLPQPPGESARFRPRQGFQSRFGSASSCRAPPPRPLRSLAFAPPLDGLEPSTRSPDGSPTDLSSDGRHKGLDETRAWPGQRLPCSPFSKPPLRGDFPVSKGLPRGRRLEPPQTPQTSPAPTPDVAPDSGVLSFPAWLDFDRSKPRRSAMPAPLTPNRACASFGGSPGLSTPTSATALMPSPTLPSLETSLSGSSNNTFGPANGHEPPGSAATVGEFPSIDGRSRSSAGNSGRVMAKKAPPRLAAASLPLLVNHDRCTSPFKSPSAAHFAATHI